MATRQNVPRGEPMSTSCGAAKWALLLLLSLVFQSGFCQARSEPGPLQVGAERVFHEGIAGQSFFDLSELTPTHSDIDGRKLATSSYTCTSAPSGICPTSQYTGCCTVSGLTCIGIALNKNCNTGLPCPSSAPVFSCCTDFSKYLFCPGGSSGPVCDAPAPGYTSSYYATCTSSTGSSDYGACCLPSLGTCAAGPYNRVVGTCDCPDSGPIGACCSETVVDTYYCPTAPAPTFAPPARTPAPPVPTFAPPVPTFAPPVPTLAPPTQNQGSNVISNPPAPPTPVANPVPPAPSSSKSSMVPVVAGVLGGVALIAAVLGGVLFYMCCKKNNAPALYAGGVSKDAAYVSGIPVAAAVHYPANASATPVGRPVNSAGGQV